MHTMDTSKETRQSLQESAIRHRRFVALPLLGLALMSSATADELLHPRLLAQNLSTEERAALREHLGTRMREMSPAEQALMRDSAYDGRKRKENEEDAHRGQRGGRGDGGG